MKRNIYTSLFGIVLGCNIFFSLPVSAENLMNVTSCEAEMISAFSEADRLMNEQLKAYLEIPEVTAIGKSGNMGTYKRTYECHNQVICFAVRNPNPENKIPSKFGNCNNMTTVKDLQEQFSVDFSQCNNLQYLESATIIYNRCSAFAQQKNKIGENYMALEFIKEVQLQNQSFLGGKILEIRKRMEILIKKTRKFSTHFNKVIDDIRCTLPERSGYEK